MNLHEWYDQGVDVISLIGSPVTTDEDTLVSHGSMLCKFLERSSASRQFSDVISLDSELCDECWTDRLTGHAAEVVEAMEDLDYCGARFRAARSAGRSPEAFRQVLSALHSLPVPGTVDVLSARFRAEVLAWFDQVFPLDAAERLERSAARVGEPFSGLTGIVSLNGEVSVGVLRHLPEADVFLAAMWWVPDSSLPGFTFEAPLEVVEHLVVALVAAGARYPEHVSYVQLEPADTPAVREVAAALFDFESELFGQVDRAFSAARAV